MAGFDSTAMCYDVLAGGEERLAREGPLLRRFLGSGRRAVDLACGTGLHAHFLAEEGFAVDAFDLSPEMVAYAEEHRSHPRIAYAVGDMRDPRGGPWDAALCLGNSLSLLPDAAALAQTFGGVHAQLAAGGRFITQTLNYARPEAQRARHRVQEASVAGQDLVAVKSLVPRGDRTLLTLNFFVFRGADCTTLSDTALLWNWSAALIEGAAASAGFSTVAQLGSFDGLVYDPETSSDLIFVFAKHD